MKKISNGWLLAVLFLSSVLVSAQGVHGRNAEQPPGEGTEASPYLISTLEHLFWITEHGTGYQSINDTMHERWRAHYKQVADINAGATSSNAWFWQQDSTFGGTSKGWLPIGKRITATRQYQVFAFEGVYDGNGFTISNLFTEWVDDERVGLFAEIASQGVVKNLTLQSANIRGDGRVGAIAGHNRGEIVNVDVSGQVSALNTSGRHILDGYFADVGGVVGRNFATGTITQAYSSASVSGDARRMGGLVGFNEGVISFSGATGRVFTFREVRERNRDEARVGGFVGFNRGTILASFATGNVEIDLRMSQVGGFAGRTEGTIRESFATGNVRGRSEVGGFIGSVGRTSGMFIQNNYALGDVLGQVERVGGFIGGADVVDSSGSAEIRSNYSTGLITYFGSDSDRVGGFSGIAFNSELDGRPFSVSRNYWNTESSGQADSPSGQALDEFEMRSASSFRDWNFSSQWTLLDDINVSTYPYLASVPYNAPGGTGPFADLPGLKRKMVLTYDTNLTGNHRVGFAFGGLSDFLLDLGDGSAPIRFTNTTTQTLSASVTPGVHTITLLGNLDHFGQSIPNTPVSGIENLVSVESFGDLRLLSLEGAFRGAVNLETVPETLPSTVTNLRGVFEGASVFDGDIAGWDTSNVTNMSRAFWEASAFNQEIGTWNVSGVTVFSSMFVRASEFNADLSDWDVSNADTFFNMFSDASSFEGQGLSGWQTGKATNMNGMFSLATSFDADLSEWDVSSVTSMDRMFLFAPMFDSDLSKWNVSNVTNMYAMFAEAEAFKGKGLSEWDISAVVRPGAGTGLDDMLTNSGLTRENYDQILLSWSQLAGVPENLSFNASPAQYTAGPFAEARQLLIDEYGWTITDNGPVSFATGTGSAADPYQVTDWLELNQVRQFPAASFRLANDLDASSRGYDLLVKAGETLANSGLGWLPIEDETGVDTAGFTGHFDGQGHSIHGLIARNPDRDRQGLFGWLANGGLIENLGVVNVDIEGDRWVGGLVARSEGVVRNTFATGSLSGNQWIGGLVGRSFGGTIESSFAIATVTGGTEAGGLVGENRSDATISNSFSSGTVSGTNFVGGLVGDHRSTIPITNSYSMAAVEGDRWVGGLAGFVGSGSSIQRSYAAGAVTGVTDVGGLVGESRGTVESSFYDQQTSGQSDTDRGLAKTSDLLQLQSTFEGEGWDFDEVWALTDSSGGFVSYPFLRDFDYEDIATLTGDTAIPGFTEKLFASGAGTVDSPFIIESWSQLNNVRRALGAAFRLEADLTPAQADYTDVASASAQDDRGMTPIGRSGDTPEPFTGQFDGNSHSIQGVVIRRDDSDDVGLFGFIEGALISDLFLLDVDIEGNSRTGGLVGHAVNSTLTANFVSGSVSGADQVGGLAGRVEGTGEVLLSGASVSVIASGSSVGGLIGHQGVLVTQSFSTGEVVGQTAVGGLIGLASNSVNQSFASGSVSGLADLGGLIGVLQAVNSVVENCYATGDVTALGEWARNRSMWAGLSALIDPIQRWAPRKHPSAIATSPARSFMLNLQIRRIAPFWVMWTATVPSMLATCSTRQAPIRPPMPPVQPLRSRRCVCRMRLPRCRERPPGILIPSGRLNTPAAGLPRFPICGQSITMRQLSPFRS